MLTVYQCITMEGWTKVLYWVCNRLTLTCVCLCVYCVKYIVYLKDYIVCS